MCVKKKLWPVVALGVLVAGFCVYHYVLSSILSFDCVHDLLSEAASPDGQYIATISERGCGTTTRDYRVVSLRHRGNRFDGEDHKSWVFWMEGNPEVKANWSGRRQLTVLYPAAMGKRVEVGHWKDVAIASQESP